MTEKLTYAQIADTIRIAKTHAQINSVLAHLKGMPIEQQKELRSLAGHQLEIIEKSQPEAVEQEPTSQAVSIVEPAPIEEKKKTLSLPATDLSPEISPFLNLQSFESAQRVASLIAKSSVIPKEYRENIPNIVIALEIAHRVKASPLAVMQSLFVINGRPSWSAQYIIASLNTCGKFSPLRFQIEGEGDALKCTAYAVELATKTTLKGPAVSIAMAKAEGWWDKKDSQGRNVSKWPTMTELMLMYRSASFFGKLYAPEIMMGMQSAEEVGDIIDVEPERVNQDVSHLDSMLFGKN